LQLRRQAVRLDQTEPEQLIAKPEPAALLEGKVLAFSCSR